MPIRCYAQRLLNPFRGVKNVIEYQAAEAVTVDGLHRDIYVRKWQVPWLLLLQHLDDDIRRYYEPLARQQAALVDKNHHLYPQVIDPAQINAARVETQLRRSQSQSDDAADDLTVYDIKLGKSEYGKYIPRSNV